MNAGVIGDIVFSILPLGAGIVLIVTAFRPGLLIRSPEKAENFKRLHFIWILVGFLLIIGGVARIVTSAVVR